MQKMDKAISQLLTKMAYTPPKFQGQLYNSGYSTQDPADYAKSVSQDVQQYGQLTPGSYAYNQVMKQKGFSPEYMQGLTSLGGRVLGAAADPKFVADMQSGNADFSRLYGDITPVQAMGGYGNVARYAAMNPIEAAKAGWKAFTGNSPAYGHDIAKSVVSSFDYNSPLMRQAKERAATSYMQNAIQGTGQNWGRFGSGLRGVLSFLLGMGSKIPGYGYLANKLLDFKGWGGAFDQAKQQFMQSPAPPLQSVPLGAQIGTSVLSRLPNANPGIGFMNAASGLFKRSSHQPYSNYKVTRTRCGTEVLTPWNPR